MHRLRRHEGATGVNVAGMRVEVCPDEGRAMRSSPLRRQARRFGRGHNLPPVDFRCSAPQRDGKSPKPNSNPASVRATCAVNLQTSDYGSAELADRLVGTRGRSTCPICLINRLQILYSMRLVPSVALK